MHGMIAASVASEQCRRLAAEGLTRMHVYALNRAELPLAIRHLLAAHEMPAAA
jgi:methylenetetrahydrofolate reductase (NADPH)